MKSFSFVAILCVAVGCGSRATEPARPQPDAPVAPDWTRSDRPNPVAAISAEPAGKAPSAVPRDLAAGSRSPALRPVEHVATRIERATIPRDIPVPAEEGPAYNLPLDLNIPVPEVPEAIQAPTPADSISQP